jgi:hypothetical protein
VINNALNDANRAEKPVTVCSYHKGGAFTTKFDLKNEYLINLKTVFGTQILVFRVGAVSGCLSIVQVIV